MIRDGFLSRWCSCFLISCSLAAPALPLAAPPPPGPETEKSSAPGQEEIIAAMMELAKPGPNHEFLKSFVGSWSTESKMWNGPGDPQVTRGTSEFSMILGGRFLTEQLRGEVMGQPFEGFGVYGYDNQKKQFVSIWADSMSTKFVVAHGRLDGSRRTLTFEGTFDDPATGESKPIKLVTRIVSDDEHVFSMFGQQDGREAKEMEITYTRR